MTETDNEKISILIVDDELWIRKLLFEVLNQNYLCQMADSAEEALSILQTKNFDLALCDIKMRGMTGLELIPHILASSPETVVMMITGEQAIENAIQAIRAGAFDYIQKPFSIQYVETAVRRAISHRKRLRSKRFYENDSSDSIEKCVVLQPGKN